MEIYAAICVSGLVFFTILAVFAPIGQERDRIRRRISEASAAETVKELEPEELVLPFSERFLKPILRRAIKELSRLTPRSENPKLTRDLGLAGIGMTPKEFTAVRIVSFVIFFAAGVFTGLRVDLPPLIKLLLFSAGPLLGVFLPGYVVKKRATSRGESIRRQIPDIMDLLCVNVEAGLGFDAALLRVTDRSTGPLVDELITVHREISMGRPRREALSALSARCPLDEVKSFSSSVIQADQLGVSLKNVLKNQSNQLRQQRRRRCEEKAMKAPVKMIIPLIIFIFPVIFIILLAPSVINLMGSF